jgi:hypothetical protein
MKKFCSTNQLPLFELLKDLRPKIEISVLNIDLLFRTTLAKAIKESSLSRIQIAAKMSEALDVEITKTMLDSWTAESREGTNRFPACYLPIFCHVVGSIEPLKVLADLIGCFVVEGKEALLIEKSKLQDQRQRITAKEKAIDKLLEGIER